MTPLRQMSYEGFGKLRFLDFFPKTDAYSEAHDFAFESGIGLAGTEGYLETKFTSPIDADWQTSEMWLELGGDCPESQGHALLDGLGLRLRKGMTASLVREALGVSPDADLWPIEIGDKWPYYVGCSLSEAGLTQVWICRKDLADAQTELES